MKVTIDRENCIGCGACEAVCPEVFQLADDGKSSIVENIRKAVQTKAELKTSWLHALKAQRTHAQ